MRSRGDLVPPSRALVTRGVSNVSTALLHESWMEATEIVALRPDEEPVCRVWCVTHRGGRVRVWKAYGRNDIGGFNRIVVERLLRDLHPEFIEREGAEVALLSYNYVSTVDTWTVQHANACYKVLQAQLKILHDELQYVHADIRLDNLLICDDASKSKIIDFDLARPIVSTPRYPARYNHLRERHVNATAGQRIVKNHDRFALWASLFPDEVNSASAYYAADDTDMGDAAAYYVATGKRSNDGGEVVPGKRRR